MIGSQSHMFPLLEEEENEEEDCFLFLFAEQ